ncbi:MAG: hypothetical protein MJ061_01540 [Mailhella sp.]|nr:hypothetical protein [Mailhella sp.]
MKMRNIITTAFAALLLAGCSGSGMPEIKNPFEQPSLTETYVSQFADVPIPAPMSTKVSETLVTVATDGSKYGLESFSGRVDGVSLANVMMQNMARAGWQLRGSSIGVRSIQLYEKAPHYAALFFKEGPVYSSMDVWVINGVNVDILGAVPAAHLNNTGASIQPAARQSSTSAAQVTKLAE